MVLKGKVCKRGLWDESVAGIAFNEEGVSNYAQLHDALMIAYPRKEQGLADWNVILEKIRKKGRGKRYDCVIGVSGGTDSCYLLHLAKEYGLRPLAVNLDNGWSSDIAVKNIKKITKALDIDLDTYVIDYEEIKDLLRSYMLAGLPWIDIPTDLAIKSILYSIANREGIKYVLRGNDFRSEGSQPTEWTYGDGKQLLAVHRKYGKKELKSFPNYTLTNVIYYGFIRGIKSVYPFYYLDYNKNEAQIFLKNRYNWEYYGGHHFENVFTRFAISYWLNEKFDIDKRKITLSAQVLSGEISRECALEMINKPPYDKDEIKPMIDFVLKKLDFTQEEFQHILQSPNHSYKDYPYYRFIFSSKRRIIDRLLQLLFIHKPQSMYKAEIIK